jgi:hypothetical protein
MLRDSQSLPGVSVEVVSEERNHGTSEIPAYFVMNAAQPREPKIQILIGS